MSNTPGTVSKILWHFTGGGSQNGDDPNQRLEPKSVKDSVDILYQILEGTYLKASAQPELFKVVRHIFKIHEHGGHRGIRGGYEKSDIKTSRVVCLAEIPIQHLHFHARRYGKVAIGFHRQAIFDNGFNPVTYLSDYSDVARSVSFIHGIVSHMAKDPLDSLNLVGFSGTSEQRDIIGYKISNHAENLLSEIENVMSNIKSFSANEFDTIYCEREWRATHDFHFHFDAIAMIVLPKVGGYLNRFIKDHPKLPRHIPIVSWEDLIEH